MKPMNAIDIKIKVRNRGQVQGCVKNYWHAASTVTLVLEQIIDRSGMKQFQSGIMAIASTMHNHYIRTCEAERCGGLLVAGPIAPFIMAFDFFLVP